MVGKPIGGLITFAGVPMGVAPDQTDNLILDFKDGHSESGYGHPGCKGGKPSEDAITKLPKDFPKGIGPGSPPKKK